MNWWSTNKLRLIQNNLREIDADLDVDRLISELKQYEANVLMMNAGGMFAFYPTELDFQYVTPYLKKDLLGEAVAKAHESGMKFIARFDFSKAHESLFERSPEWFYRTRAGQEVNYDGIVHTCLNSEYQQQLSLRMIEEVIAKYPVDGIFFNMFGYQHWDYSGNHYGPCYCDNCKRRFAEMYGADLTRYDGPGHELHEAYRQFQEITVRDILRRIQEAVKTVRPDVAICTYFPDYVDIVRKESNTALHRVLPTWLYSASENVASVENSWDDKLVSNCCINAIDLTYRFTGVSKHEVEIRLYENIANGSGLDFCIIGAFDGYPDEANFEAAKAVYQFHSRHERFYGNLESMADVALIKPKDAHALKEYEGLFKMLKESHILFDVVVQDRLAGKLEALRQVKAVMLPAVARLEAGQREALVELQREGIHLIATGGALQQDALSLDKLFGAASDGRLNEKPAAYLNVSDKRLFPSLEKRSWIIADQAFSYTTFEQGADRHMPFIAPSSFGPPERAYGHAESGWFGLGIVKRGGRGVYYPWNPGALYARHGFEDHKYAVIDVLKHLLEEELRLSTDAPACTEWFLHRQPDGSLMLHALNLSGFNGLTYSQPLPLSAIRVELRGLNPPARVYALRTGQELSWQPSEDGIAITVALPDVYEAVIIEQAT
ncbi:family 10 glycosylhydrolase [Paenibacillus puerhi]|uniref:family 10 glycosylhydrolase n=1 Tax=Paenibacillus puerhi TaxID=2692622 RepID=UPI001356A07D|nr:family 10 glycosylhydrolase [Paenibacillus puerhi]